MTQKLLKNYHLKNRLAVGFALLVFFSSLINSSLNYYENKNILYENIDKMLKNSTLTANLLLGEDFHNRAISNKSIDKEEDLSNILLLSKFTNNTDVEYIYSMVQKDGQIYFTTSSATKKEIENNNMTSYFDCYDEATPVLLNILKSNTIKYEESTDKWGTFRTVFIPFITKNGNKYIVGADIKIDFIQKNLDKYIQKIFIAQSVILFLLIILGIFFIKISKKEIFDINQIKKELEKKVKEKTQELVNLNNLLEKRVDKEIKENLKKTQQLLNQSKLAQMGDMINMIAHQWRQPLNAISASSINLSLLSSMGMLEDSKIQESSEFIENQTQKMSQTINTFMNFGKPAKESKEFILSHTVEAIMQIMGTQLANHNIEVNVKSKDDDISLVGFEDLLEQVIINLLSNARDAFEELDIENKKIDITIDIKNSIPIIIIEDNAGGIPQEIQNKIFNPYFTTKEQGKGTGIGLYMSMDIMKKSFGGDLVYSAIKGGSEFEVVCGKR